MKSSVPIIFIILLVLLLVAGATFLGIFSCGGFIWHRLLIYSLIVVLVVLCMFNPLQVLRGNLQRILIPVASIVLFLSVRASASAFYPSVPDSIVSFIESFWMAIIHGPC